MWPTLKKLYTLHALGTLLSGLYYLLQIYLFGTSRDVELYFAAFQIYMLGNALIQVDNLSGAFIGHIVQVGTQEGPATAQRHLALLANVLLLASLLVAIAAGIAAAWLMPLFFPGFSPAEQARSAQMAALLAAGIPIYTLNGLARLHLLAQRRYQQSEWANVLSTGLSLLVLWGLSGWGIMAMIASFGSNLAFQAALYGLQLRRLGYRHHWGFRAGSFSAGRYALRQAGYLYAHALAHQAQNIAFGAALSYLPAGDFALFRYAENIYRRINTTFLKGIETVLHTELAAHLAKGEHEAAAEKTGRAILGGLLLAGLLLCTQWAAGEAASQQFLGSLLPGGGAAQLHRYWLSGTAALLFAVFAGLSYRLGLARQASGAVYRALALSRLGMALLAGPLIGAWAAWGLCALIVLEPLLDSLLLSWRVFKGDLAHLRWPGRRAGRLGLLLALGIGTAAALRAALPGDFWPLAAILAGACYVLLALRLLPEADSFRQRFQAK